MFTHTDESFSLERHFRNPLQNEADDTVWEITGTVSPASSDISFDGNNLVVDDIEETFVTGTNGNAVDGNDTFVDVIVDATARNDAGSVKYALVLRVKSSKPTIVDR